jgi:hypothetical protein
MSILTDPLVTEKFMLSFMTIPVKEGISCPSNCPSNSNIFRSFFFLRASLLCFFFFFFFFSTPSA